MVGVLVGDEDGVEFCGIFTDGNEACSDLPGA